MKKLKIRYGVKSKLLFPNRSGKHLKLTSIVYHLNRCGLHITRTHIFRHKYASFLAEQKLPLEVIPRRLWHENDVITKRINIHVTKNNYCNFSFQLEYIIYPSFSIIQTFLCTKPK